MARNFYQGTDAEVLAGTQQASAKFSAEPQLWGITATGAAGYADLVTDFTARMAAVADPETRTRGNTTLKRQSKAALQKASATIVSLINGTPTVTDAMKENIGINVRKKPSPIPAPTTRPAVDVLGVTTQSMTVGVHSSTSQTKRGKEYGAQAAWVYSFVGENYPSDPTAWTFQGSTTNGRLEVTFPDTTASGAQVWVCAAWVSFRGEAGPVSVPVTTYLQVGGVNAAPGLKIAA